MLDIVAAPPLLTVQDLGRPGYRMHGIAPGGALDRWALQVANLLCGNDAADAALEWADGGGMMRFHQEARFAIAGATVEATLDGAPVPLHACVHANAGAELELGRMTRGRLAYVAVAGGIAVPPVLGSAATYLVGGFGGLDGRRLRRGDRLPLGPSSAERPGPAPGFTCPADLRDPVPPERRGTIRVVAGPQAERIGERRLRRLLGEPLQLSAQADRVGYRLALQPSDGWATGSSAGVAGGGGGLLSEPGCPGAVQLPPGGRPIVLMADGPTVGGYAKPLVVCAADLGELAQCPTGTTIEFELVTVEEAQRLYRRRRVAIHTLATLVRGTDSGSYSGGP